MQIICHVTIEPTESENKFSLTFHNIDSGKKNRFNMILPEILRPENQVTQRLTQNPMDIGEALFRFLDGDSCNLQVALNEADRNGESLILYIWNRVQKYDWPFECLAKDGKYLLIDHIHLVRCMTEWKPIEEKVAETRQLRMLFMACSASDYSQLDFEQEEESIFKITEKMPIDIEVEDSGSLTGLKEKLEQTEYDVVHISGHAAIDEKGNPYLIMENDIGESANIYPEELWNGALIENPPRLLFLSSCHTGMIAHRDAVATFANVLMNNHKISAVLGWSDSIDDKQAICASSTLYHELSLGRTILDAVKRTRYELNRSFHATPNQAWPLLRLFSRYVPTNPLVIKSRMKTMNQKQIVHRNLKHSELMGLEKGFVGHRRELQQSLKALKNNPEKLGLLLLGLGGFGKSCLVGKICERFPDHTFVIIKGELGKFTLQKALKGAFIATQDENGKQKLSQTSEMEDILTNLCPTSFKNNENNKYLIIFDQFEENIEGAAEGKPRVLLPEAATLLKALLSHIHLSNKMTQLIIASRYEFTLTENGKDLIKDCLEFIRLNSFQPADILKKIQELPNISNYRDESGEPLIDRLVEKGATHPLLMESINREIGEIENLDSPKVIEVIKNKKEELIRDYHIAELIQHGGQTLSHLLGSLSVYRLPVNEDGVKRIAEKTGLKTWKDDLQKGIALSLIEYDPIRHTYQLTPLLRQEFYNRISDIAAHHKAAYEYYQTVLPRDDMKPILLLESIYHATECGEEADAVELGICLIHYLREHMSFREAKDIGLSILRRKKKELSNESDANLLKETGLALRDLGDYQQAIELQKEALKLDRALFGDAHETVAIGLSNLGAAWYNLEEGPQKAIEYNEQGLRLIENEGLDKLHPELVANICNNLGIAWKAKKEFNKAIDYFLKAHELWKNCLDQKHPNIAAILNNLGATYFRMHEYEKALEHLKEALEIDLERLGKHDREIATDLNNLAAVYDKLQDHEKSLKCYQQALHIWQEVYGQDHLNTARTLINLGEVHLQMENKIEAHQCYTKAHTIFKAFSGEKNPDTIETAEKIKAIGLGCV